MQNEKRKWLIRCEVMMYLRGQAGLFDETLLVTASFDLGVRYCWPHQRGLKEVETIKSLVYLK